MPVLCTRRVECASGIRVADVFVLRYSHVPPSSTLHRTWLLRVQPRIARVSGQRQFLHDRHLRKRCVSCNLAKRPTDAPSTTSSATRADRLPEHLIALQVHRVGRRDCGPLSNVKSVHHRLPAAVHGPLLLFGLQLCVYLAIVDVLHIPSDMRAGDVL